MITIEFVGMQRILTGIERIDMPLDGRLKVIDALNYVRDRYPELPLEDKMVLMIVNQEMAFAETPLEPGDVLCFLPAIGGG